MPLRSSLDRPCGHPADDAPLEDQKHQQRGDQDNHGAGHGAAVGGLLREVQGLQAHLNRSHLVAGVGDDQRPEVHVPGADERGDENRDQDGAGDGQEDLPVKAEVPAAVDLGRLPQGLGHRQEVLAHHEDVVGRDKVQQHDAKIGVDQA